MKKIFFFLSLCTVITLHVHAQVFVVAGINQTGITMVPNDNNPQFTNGYAWQVGSSVTVPVHRKAFLYSGFLFEAKKYDRKYEVCCYISLDETYHPYYISLPLGGGVKIPLSKSVQLEISGGAYISYAIGGSVNGVGAVGDFGPPTITYFNRKINFGGTVDNDITRWNWGLQLGSAIAWKKFAVQVSYKRGMSNLLPDNYFINNGTSKNRYHSTSVDLAYRLFILHK